MSNKLSTPHVLVIISLVLVYILPFIPALVVVYQPLQSGQTSLPNVNETKTAYLRLGDSIEGIIDHSCFSIQVVWSSRVAQSTFWIFSHGAFLIILPILLWFTPYLKAYPVPIPLYFLILVILLLGPVIILLVFFNKSVSVNCSPIPTFVIIDVVPFWPAVLSWLGSVGTAILALRQINIGKNTLSP